MRKAMKSAGVVLLVVGTYFGILGLGSLGRSVDAGAVEAANAEPKVAVEEAEQKSVPILEQAIFDAFPADGSKGSEDAKDFIAAAINTKGYLCADPVKAAKAESQENIYGIKCVMNRDGTGVAAYIVDVGTGLVMPFQ